MMMIESDLQLLEEHLDGELDPALQAKLRHRLTTEPTLSAQLKELQSQRALRQAAFSSIEPSELSAQQLVWRVRGAMLSHDQSAQIQSSPSPVTRRWNSWNIARFGSAAAACVVLGFFTGRLGRGGPAAPAVSPQPDGIVSAAGNGTLTAYDHTAPVSPGFTPVAATPRISVPITNEYGQVVAWQTFDNPEQAKNFAEDLGHAHAQQPASTGQTKLVDAPQPF